MLHAAEQLRDRNDIVFVFVGDGAKKKDLQEIAARRDLRNVMFLPFQPRELMDQSVRDGGRLAHLAETRPRRCHRAQ